MPMAKKRSASEAGHAPDSKAGKKWQKRNDQNARDKLAKASIKRQSLIFEPRPDWHAAQLPSLSPPETSFSPTQHVLSELQKYAFALLDEESASYAETKSSSSTNRFMSTIMASGTLEDKVSALTLLAQESPLHNRKAFENLVGLARKRSRNQAIMALGAIKDLLGQGVVLPANRKLRPFAKQPGLAAAFQNKVDSTGWQPAQGPPGQIQKVHLVSWAYEDWLKRAYFELLRVIEGWCNDEVEFARSRALTFAWELLKEKPEQEENLLRLVINKLGDREKKIASRASYLLLQLQVSHPLMKEVIIKGIESELLFRPGQSSHAKYYAIITLNQTILSAKEQSVANKLLDIYFALFISLLKGTQPAPQILGKANGHVQGGSGGKPGRKAMQKAKLRETQAKSEEELKQKMIAQVLTGVNRAFPFASTDDATFEAKMDTIFRVTHSSNFNTSVQALMLVQQISSSKQYSADRFYRTLYESLLDPRLIHSSKQIMYLNLLYRSLKSDISIKRVKAFIKRLLQTISLHDPPFACGVIYLISELQTTFPSIRSMLTDPEDVEEDEEKFVDVPETEGSPVKMTVPEERNGQPQRPLRYDGRKRDPEHSNADRSCLWELIPFQGHFHPSVSLFASHLLLSKPMPPKPDPTLHTLMHFLDRFAYRNAKTKGSGARGASIMQPLAGADTSDLLIKNRDGGRSELPLNSEAFWNKKAEDVAADEVFFHNYFNQSNKKRGKKERKARQVDEGSEAQEVEEEEIWKALVDSKPELEAADGDEDDLEMEDYDSAEDIEVDEADVGAIGDNQGEDTASLGSDIEIDALESGEDAYLDSEDEVPSELDGSATQADIEGNMTTEVRELGPLGSKRDKKGQKKKLKHLPTFASADDYAQLLDGEDDE